MPTARNAPAAVAISGVLYVAGGNTPSNGLTLDAVEAFTPPSSRITVTMDIKPGSDLNSINLANKGVIPVVVFTTADFDAQKLDASTVIFAGAYAVKSSLKDVDHDGDLDMVLQFRTQATNLVATYKQLLSDCDTVNDGVLDPGCSTHQQARLSLTGRTVDGMEIIGSDMADLFLSGKALRDLLNELAATGAI